MKSADLVRTAYTVECFLNALRVADGRERTSTEASLVNWLGDEKNREGYVVYHEGNLFHHRGRVITHQAALPQATLKRTLWCNGKKLSIIDGIAYTDNGRLLMLGTAGLILSMPGSGNAASKKEQRSSNNNNNNNNNNNG